LKAAAHDDEKWRCLSDLDQRLILRRLSAHTQRRDPLDLRFGELGKSRSACDGAVVADGTRAAESFTGRPPVSLSI
jgi:hypothetical protein